MRQDTRLLEPGWGGELAPDEFEFILSELLQDKKLSFAWGFQPGKKRRPEWSIRQVAMWGDSEHRGTNMQLARKRLPETGQFGTESPELGVKNTQEVLAL